MQNEQLNILQTTVKIGLEAPVRFLHVTDSHISLADEYDSERLKWLAAARRANCFETGRQDGVTVRLYEQALDYARKNELFVVCTGDLIDFMSHANFAYLDHAFDGVDYVYALGNHDICAYVGGDNEDEAYKWNNMKLTAPHIRSNLYFDSKLYGGVNFVTLDNSYYLISEGQIKMLRAEAAKGYPIVLCMHTPIYTPAFAEDRMTAEKDCTYLMAPPEELLARYSPSRREQQKPDAATLEAVKYILHEPMIKAVFAGHMHYDFEEPLANGVMQYTTDGSYRGTVREVTLI